jgi:hypothetical protein
MQGATAAARGTRLQHPTSSDIDMWLVALKLQEGANAVHIYSAEQLGLDASVSERPLVLLSNNGLENSTIGQIRGQQQIRFLLALDRALCCVAILHATNVKEIFFWFILAAYDNLKPSRKLS